MHQHSAPVSDSACLLRARVLLNEPVGLLDYRIPDGLRDSIAPGVAVRVPLRKRRTSAYVVEVAEGPGPDGIILKELLGLDPERPQLPKQLLELVLFVADYYGAPHGEALAAALPPLSRPASPRFCLSNAGRMAILQRHRERDRQLLELAARFERGFTVAAVERELGWTRRQASERARRHVEKGWLRPLSRKRRPRSLIGYQRVDGPKSEHADLRPKSALKLLGKIPADSVVLATTLAADDKGVYSKLRSLEVAGLIRRVWVEQKIRPHAVPELPDTPPTPTTSQQHAIEAAGEALQQGRFVTFLLQGVTGSGKTEVYLRVIEHALALDRTALMLVPEIALTPQLGERFRRRFGDKVATFHSGLTAAERRDEWERVANGNAVIGLGARSALFLPLQNLGAIVVDEEHETSFKQEDSPRYHARDLAVVRGYREGAVVLLGSATPSLETRANAGSGRYQRLCLPERVLDRPMPEVRAISLAENERVGDGIFTEPLAEALEQTLGRDEQAILFLNRRGFAPYVFCRDCGHAHRCTDCDVALTLHRRRGALVCHYCGFEEPPPETCVSCHSHKVTAFGLGTERVEAEIESLFGAVPVSRLDSDTIRRRSDLEQGIEGFRRGDTRILIGTQMVAKGHDFPGVTLVGVVAADASLNFPDFRAAERTFQLLTQVAGRAGRGDRPGIVLMQAYDTDHYAVTAAMQHDYERFAEIELAERRELDYPPFAHLALLRFEGACEATTRRTAEQNAAALKKAALGMPVRVTVLGPAAAPLARLRGLWRFQILLKCGDRAWLRRAAAAAPQASSSQVRRVLDIDPLNML